jgi:hypothetical protein
MVTVVITGVLESEQEGMLTIAADSAEVIAEAPADAMGTDEDMAAGFGETRGMA